MQTSTLIFIVIIGIFIVLTKLAYNYGVSTGELKEFNKNSSKNKKHK